MAIMDPSKIKFENQGDVIDYVTKGIPPRKKDFDELMDSIRGTDDPANHVVIAPGIEFDMDEDAFINAMNRVYKNRCRNRNILIGASIVVGGVVIAALSSQHSKINDLKAENEKLSQIIEEDLPVVNISSI